jgi:trimeric autotransporter adhesin
VSVGDKVVVEGNYIGTNAAGDAALGNAYGGLDMAGSNNTIGGTDPGAANVISGNGGVGLQLDTPAQVYGNLIGTDAAGLQAIHNTTGILLAGPVDRGATA